jgi:hypothetical protein
MGFRIVLTRGIYYKNITDSEVGQCVVFPSQKTLAYLEICQFPVNYETGMFYSTGPWARSYTTLTAVIYEYS